MHREIANRLAEIAAICRTYGVSRLELFGSAARGADFDDDLSDVDFLVEFMLPSRIGPLEEYFGLRKSLAALLKRDVDLVEPAAVRNPYLQAAIDRSRQIIYAA